MMKEKLEACFNRLQTLEIQPTLANMEKLVQTLYELREMYNELEENDGRAETDPERRYDP